MPSFLTPGERRVLLAACRGLSVSDTVAAAGAAPSPSPLYTPPAVEPTRGRLHCDLTGLFHGEWFRLSLRKDTTAAASSSSSDPDSLRRAVCSVESRAARFAGPFFASASKRPRMTQLQLLDSLPGSEDQFWHCDNTAQGLTFVIALDDVAEVSGPTELLVGTQHIHDEGTGALSLSSCLRMLIVGPRPRVHRAVLSAGDAFVFDSRTLHRGGANQSARSRPVAIVRYDPSDRSPPGCGIAETMAMRVVGAALEQLAGGPGDSSAQG